MRWIVFVLGLLLTPCWMSYSFLAGSGPKVAFIPPALVLVALVLTRDSDGFRLSSICYRPARLSKCEMEKWALHLRRRGQLIAAAKSLGELSHLSTVDSE
jgi:hypothetical protein